MLSKILLVIVCAIVFVAVLGGCDYLVMMVYNSTMPHLFRWPVLTFWQTVGLVFLIGVVGNCFRSTGSKD